MTRSYEAAALRRKARVLRAVRTVGLHLLLCALGLAFFMPLVWMISTSLKGDVQLFTYPPQWIPRPPRWQNYPDAVSYINFFRYLLNTVTICFFQVIGASFSSSVVAYGFSRINWPGRDVVFGFVLATLMLPFTVTMIPLFVVFQKIHWINTFLPLTVPAFLGSAYHIFLLRQFYLTIPPELSDSARIDGCSELGIYARLILPLSKSALAVVALFNFLFAWQDFLGPLVYLSDERLYTLAIGIRNFFGRRVEWQMLMATSTLITLPIIVLFFFTQKTFLQGIALSGIKE